MRVRRISVRQIGGLLASGTVLAVAAIAGASPAAALTPVVITPASLASPQVGVAYSAHLTASGGTSPYTFTVEGGLLPAGLTLTAPTATTVDISGTPTTAGAYSFSIKAVDAATGSATQAYSGTVQPNISIAPTALPNSPVGVAYSQTIVASGGTAPYRYGLTLGSTLPPGLTLNASSGVLSGAPTTAGTYTFNVQVTDSTTGTGAPFIVVRSYTVQIGAAQSISFANPGAKALGTTYQLVATASPSGLPVTFASASPAICTVGGTNGATLTPVAVGTCFINADQAGGTVGTTTYSAATQVQQSFAIQAVATTITVAANPTASVIGQPVTYTATLSTPVPPGQLQWSVDGTNVGSPVTLVSTTSSYTFTSPTQLAVGTHTIKATYVGDATHATSSGQMTETVSKASTTTTVAVSGSTLTATVAPVSPGTGVPTGTVTFTLNGVPLGTATLSSGAATFNSTNVGNHAVSATYSGDSSFLTSSGNRASIPPTVVARVHSSAIRTRAGWYNAPVSVSFTCTANTAPIVSCPATQTLSRNGGGQSVTATATATDGGTTTVTKSGINIDKSAPSLRVTRRGTRLSCHALDGLSGVKSCRITRHVRNHNTIRTVSWTAVARDHAGNSRTKHGKFSYLI